ncbi:hypothetical protein Syun_030839 [Stephania yunnanensis]|uniref:B-block binding subunit of TFIIIC domain-containing protein n=1 Tax=Stephania yunnanensis TaxID=152371 RepID=A0AAP0DY00_9MAGN
MDSIVSSALSEICSNGALGLSLADLWPRLHQPLASAGLHLCTAVKSAVYEGLLAVPGLELHSSTAAAASTPRDPRVRSLEEAEGEGLRVVAPEHLRDCFVGIYDIKAADTAVSAVQRSVLERLALASTNGVIQSELAKELGVKGNNMFYILRNLETRGLIVRQSTIVRKKVAASEGENTSIMRTNMIYLYRYAKHLSSQQRLEITKANASESLAGVDADNVFDDCAGEGMQDDIIVKDFLPAMRAVCEKLEEADDKVLVASDVKQALGYRGLTGRRTWTSVCNRLKEAGLVEVFNAEVNKKVVSCLRQLKNFEMKNFQPKHSGSGHDELDSDQLVKCASRGQIINQFLELPIEHQVYDMIDAAGSKGITFTEICKQLGLNNKRNYPRLLNMFSRFGIHVQAECPNKAMQYRVWTSRNFNQVTSHAVKDKPDFLVKEGCSMQSVGDVDHHENLDQARQLVCSNYDSQLQSPVGEMLLESCCASPGDSNLKQMVLRGNNPMPSDHGKDGMDSNENYTKDMIKGSNSSLIETPSITSKQSRTRSYPIHPCLTSAEASKREQRILEWLQEEKFILTVELHKWVESLEKEKRTTMDRKTLTRTLNKLQQGGHCKCIQVEVPVITNCGRSRTIDVVVHRSLQTIPTDFKSQIHERFRAFEMQCRARGLARLKTEKSIPVLTNIKRTVNRSIPESQAVTAEAMRANGFIGAKMVRAKLLHNFLWNYLSTSPDWDDVLSDGRQGCGVKNPHSTCKLFSLDVAMKAMPLELFLQVVGSTHKFEDLVDLFNRGVALSDLSKQLYKSLMDTRATGRLSLIVDILRRLKLIRLVNDGDFDKGDKGSRATLRYALELKPYIEEPSSVPELDLRPSLRHDFMLLIEEAVDKYWKTLEYCYAAADPTIAIHAFPGSAVREVFLFRAWASVRVMTGDQRAELLKRIVRDESSKKLSFSDCVKISKDLNLTLDQVLRYANRHSRFDEFQRDLYPKDKESQPISNHKSDSRKRNKRRSSKRLKLETANGESCKQLMPISSDNDGQCVKNHTHFLTDLGEADISIDAWDEDGQAKVTDEHELNENAKKNDDFINQCAFSRSHQSRFLWTDVLDKQLVIQYARCRAVQGAKINCAYWSSIPDLPAPPTVCRRRMRLLNSNENFRKSLMRLCNLLGERYSQHLSKAQGKDLDHQKTLSSELCVSVGEVTESDIVWDDFDDSNVRVALDEVLQLKGMSKSKASRGGVTAEMEWPDAKFDMANLDEQEKLEMSMPVSGGENHPGKRKRQSSCHGVPGKFLKLLDDGISVSRRACESLAVANAVELLKLVFLSTSRTSGVPNVLAETLRRYSEHDLFAAFNYLREKKFMVGGSGIQPFGLSQQFLHNISSSPFPANTGKRAIKFSSWLKYREKDLIEEGVFIDEDLQCGDIFHLLSLVSAGLLFISPLLPDKGIGEAERDEACSDNSTKKINSSQAKDGLWEFVSRREKGFPGIKVSLGCIAISTADALELFKNEMIQTGTSSFDDDPFSQLGSAGSLPCPNNSYQSHSFDSTARVARISNHQSPWKAMAIYSEYVMPTFSEKELVGSLSPDFFMNVCSDIRKAGDQGLSIDELSKLTAIQGRTMAELVVDILQTFGLVIKVNAYNAVHVVDSAFRSKYFLNSVDGHHDNLKPAPCMNSPRKNEGNYCTSAKELKSTETRTNIDYIHKVTVLSFPEEISQLSNESQTHIEDFQPSECMEEEVVSLEEINEDGLNECMTSENTRSFKPMLPWINGDGTTNTIVIKGLVRRILGIVMQNPGIQENDIIHRMDVLNPQSCRKLLEMMILDNNLIARKMHQTVSSGPPSLLAGIFGSNFKKPETVCREHFYANPMSASLL